MSFSDRIKDVLWGFQKSRKAKVTVLVILLVGVATAAGYVLFNGGGAKPLPANENTNLVNLPSKEQEVRRAIDGVMVPISRANSYPVSVVIENLVDARPQSGLDQANLVYEYLAEGGITRFLATFAAGRSIDKIGPVRSARPVALDVVQELKSMFLHAGGSPAALQTLANSSISDLNQFTNSQYYWRDKERLKTKALEHTLYTSSELIARALRDKQAPLVGSYAPWLFSDDAPLAQRPADPKSVTIDFSSFNYKVEYRYVRETNEYTRYLAEQPHVTENGKDIQVKNIVVEYVPTKLADDHGRLQIDMVGDGAAVIFQNGKTINATWKKSATGERTRFYDDTGAEIHFVAGSTWVELVPNDRQVSYN